MEETHEAPMLKWALLPREDINYSFISAMYASGTALSLLLFLLETVLRGYGGNGDSSGEDETGSVAEFAQALEGLYLIFIPFFPCLLWSLFVRRRWIEQQGAKRKTE
mmetsp:Transcript_9459/g.28440  ORF Transcript_9459/g.28440 Transcript_9459/m.28440 type:complete len:107 (-) Transcript_9459:528-848(-)